MAFFENQLRRGACWKPPSTRREQAVTPGKASQESGWNRKGFAHSCGCDDNETGQALQEADFAYGGTTRNIGDVSVDLHAGTLRLHPSCHAHASGDDSTQDVIYGLPCADDPADGVQKLDGRPDAFVCVGERTLFRARSALDESAACPNASSKTHQPKKTAWTQPYRKQSEGTFPS